MALGAAQRKVMAMVLEEVSLLVGIGLAARSMRGPGRHPPDRQFLFGVTANDPATLAGYLPARSS